MIGPSPYIQIYMGARYDPCMKNIPGVQDANEPVYWPCPNATTLTSECSLSESCGFSGVPNPYPGGSLDDQPAPNQWFRFITPMFLHAGFIHIGFNMLVQLTMGAEMERMIGILRYTLTYLASGIFGFVFGGNYAAQLEPSDGCSGALFGILGLYLLDLLYDWPQRQSPWLELILMILGVAVSFVLGLLPGLDNFSHIGGFIMGLAIGLTIMRSPNALRERIGLTREPYIAMSGGAGQPTAENQKTYSFRGLFKGRAMVSSSDDNDESNGLLGFFRGRKPLWWAWWLVRAGALVAVLIAFIMLIVDFYQYPSSNCSWCYRLSCLVSDIPSHGMIYAHQIYSPSMVGALKTPCPLPKPTEPFLSLKLTPNGNVYRALSSQMYSSCAFVSVTHSFNSVLLVRDESYTSAQSAVRSAPLFQL